MTGTDRRDISQSVAFEPHPWLLWTAPPKVRDRTTTRFAPAPTGRLHLGHVANALFVWGLARRAVGMVLLRIEDHDRQRSRGFYERALLDDLDRLGLAADEPSTAELRAGASSYRQSDNAGVYEEAFQHLKTVADVYPCTCTRSTFSAWSAANGASWTGPGCPGGCRDRDVSNEDTVSVRVDLGDGDAAWTDMLAGERSGSVALAGDLVVYDRNRNWTYPFCVVVDDLRHGVDLVIRGEDLIDATPAQIRLGQLLGRKNQPTFAHHPLVLRPDGSKLSKADGATAVGELLDGGRTRAELFSEAARAVGLTESPDPLPFEQALELVDELEVRP